MAKHRIRITGAGIYGTPTSENPTGEIPIGTVIDTDGDLPAGWVGRAVIEGQEPKAGAAFLVNVEGIDPDGPEGKRLQASVDEYVDGLKRRHDDATRAIVARAERAETDLQAANEQIGALNVKLAAFDRDGDGNPGGANTGGETATADEIRSAVGLLDGNTDAHWTAAGLPAVDAVAELTGKDVTRKAITEAAPDAKRPA